MKNSLVSFIAFVSVAFMFIGGCGVMDELGNVQIGSVVLALIGAANILFISRGFKIG